MIGLHIIDHHIKILKSSSVGCQISSILSSNTNLSGTSDLTTAESTNTKISTTVMRTDSSSLFGYQEIKGLFYVLLGLSIQDAFSCNESSHLHNKDSIYHRPQPGFEEGFCFSMKSDNDTAEDDDDFKNLKKALEYMESDESNKGINNTSSLPYLSSPPCLDISDYRRLLCNQRVHHSVSHCFSRALDIWNNFMDVVSSKPFQIPNIAASEKKGDAQEKYSTQFLPLSNSLLIHGLLHNHIYPFFMSGIGINTVATSTGIYSFICLIIFNNTFFIYTCTILRIHHVHEPS
jgi:hypothetical protein